jgi:hypothetical protein
MTSDYKISYLNGMKNREYQVFNSAEGYFELVSKADFNAAKLPDLTEDYFGDHEIFAQQRNNDLLL